MMKVTPTEITVATILLSKQRNVAYSYLVYIGPTDASFMDESGQSDLLMFNIVDPAHDNYKGTIAIKRGDLTNNQLQQ
jgi:hypothetical protein